MDGSASFFIEIAAEGDGSVFVEVFGTDGQFGGFSEAWVGHQELERFGSHLLNYPLRSPVALEVGRSSADEEFRDVRLSVRQVSGAGQVAMRVQLEGDVAGAALPSARNRCVFEYFTTYADLARFAEALLLALRSGNGRADLRWERF
jgi:hypothetical protein